jgi:hypothetical protein
MADFVGMLLPLIVLWVVFALVFISIARRKGVRTLGAIAGSFPLWAVWYGIWLASKTDQRVLEKLGLPPSRLILFPAFQCHHFATMTAVTIRDLHSTGKLLEVGCMYAAGGSMLSRIAAACRWRCRCPTPPRG